tara:strand:+ start:515 stop:1432 length:918 start_codon:yes stop_codon:yes gene_type:complete
MRALVFPGQGSQKKGMASELEANFKIVKEIFAIANDTLKINLSKIILEGPEEELKKTEITQPAILTTSYAIFSVLKKEFNFNSKNVKYFAGHSLGEYSALLSSNSIKFEDALKLVHNRGKLMQEAVPLGKGLMLAVMGVDKDELKSDITKIKTGVCEIANDNSPGQIILSGNKESITEIYDLLKSNKKKTIILPVSAPFHCSLMTKAAEQMKILLNNINFNEPEIALVSNVTAEKISNKDEISNLLFKQIFSQVRWRESVEFMTNNAVNEFIEIGPGKVLSGLIKRTNDKVMTKSINNLEDIKNL